MTIRDHLDPYVAVSCMLLKCIHWSPYSSTTTTTTTKRVNLILYSGSGPPWKRSRAPRSTERLPGPAESRSRADGPSDKVPCLRNLSPLPPRLRIRLSSALGDAPKCQDAWRVPERVLRGALGFLPWLLSTWQTGRAARLVSLHFSLFARQSWSFKSFRDRRFALPTSFIRLCPPSPHHLLSCLSFRPPEPLPHQTLDAGLWVSVNRYKDSCSWSNTQSTCEFFEFVALDLNPYERKYFSSGTFKIIFFSIFLRYS